LQEGRLPEVVPGADRAPDGAGLTMPTAAPVLPGRVVRGSGEKIFGKTATTAVLPGR